LVADIPEGNPSEATAYVCENFVCQMPTRDPAALARLLTRPSPGNR